MSSAATVLAAAGRRDNPSFGGPCTGEEFREIYSHGAYLCGSLIMINCER